jgi:hypothetical protein
MTIGDIIYNTPDIDGMIVGNIFFPNGYSISILTHANMDGYELTFCKQEALNHNMWKATLDANLLTVSPENNLIGQTEEQLNNFIMQVENLSNS